MHQTKKGNQWHFGMKAHIGVDAESGLVHSVHATAANESDVTQTDALLHGEESASCAMRATAACDKRRRWQHRPTGRIGTKLTWQVAAKRGIGPGDARGRLKELSMLVEQLKAQIRAKVEHPFHVVKNLFRHKKVRYKGLAKNRRSCSACSGWPTSSSPRGAAGAPGPRCVLSAVKNAESA